MLKNFKTIANENNKKMSKWSELCQQQQIIVVERITLIQSGIRDKWEVLAHSSWRSHRGVATSLGAFPFSNIEKAKPRQLTN